MNLSELACQYREVADRVQERLAELKEQHKTARGQEAFLMQKRIETLYAELLDLRVIIGHLNSYNRIP